MFSQLTVRLGSGRPGLFVLQHVTVGPKKGPGVGRIFVSICHPCEKGLFNEECSYLDTHMKCSSSKALFGSKTQRNSDLRKFVEILSFFLQFVDVPAGERLLMPKTRVRPVMIPFLGSNLLTKIVATPMDAVSFLLTITKRA